MDVLVNTNADIEGQDKGEKEVGEAKLPPDHDDGDGDQEYVEGVCEIIEENAPIRLAYHFLRVVGELLLFPFFDLRQRKTRLDGNVKRRYVWFGFWSHVHSLLKQITGSFLAAMRAGTKPLTKARTMEIASSNTPCHGLSWAMLPR